MYNFDDYTSFQVRSEISQSIENPTDAQRLIALYDEALVNVEWTENNKPVFVWK